MKLSFIIPAYNAMTTLPRCLDSIYSLPLNDTDFEVIAVDDCSSDNSFQFLKEYSSKHKNMQVLHQTYNQRQGAARNRGVEEAIGEYIFFVDSDDEVSSGVMKALDFVGENKVDMLLCSTTWENNENLFIPHTYNIPPHQVLSRKDFVENYYNEWEAGPCTYLWRREFLLQANTPFVIGRRMEDYDFVEKHLLLANTIAYTPVITYKYYNNQGSTVNTVNPETSADWIHVGFRCMLISEMAQNTYPLFAKRIGLRSSYYIKGIMRLRNLSKFSACELRQMKKRIGNEALEYLKNYRGWNKETRFCFRNFDFLIKANYLIHPMANMFRGVAVNIRRIIEKSKSIEPLIDCTINRQTLE